MLARISAPEIDARLEQARALFEQKEIDLGRAKRLFEEGSIAPTVYDAALTEFHVARRSRAACPRPSSACSGRCRGSRRGRRGPSWSARPSDLGRRGVRARRSGPTEAGRGLRDTFRRAPGVVDVDWYVEDPHPKERLVVDKEKAALHGITAEAVAETMRIAVGGEPVGLLHVPREQEDVDIVLDVPRAHRSSVDDLLALRIPDGKGQAMVPLGELVHVQHALEERSVYHKNLLPVVYVTGDVSGGSGSPAYAVLAMNRTLATLDAHDFGGAPGPIGVYNLVLPTNDAQPAIKWDGEWHMTLQVFRELGAAFAVVLVLIYALLVGWFRSFSTPLVIMASIPFSLVGILPAHAALGAFFTAPSIVGFMAGAGIVVRNSIILVDFIEVRLHEGVPFERAVVDAGAVRFRPMLLTALAIVVGASVVLFDPIFQGLALSLAAGELASLVISRMAVPVRYSMVARRSRVQPRVSTSPSPHTPGANDIECFDSGVLREL